MNTGARVGPPACAFDPDRLTLGLDMLIASRIEAISPAVSNFDLDQENQLCART